MLSLQETGRIQFLSTQSNTFAIKMDVKERIEKVHKFFENVWSPERKQLIDLLAKNEKELQEQKKKHVSNSVVWSKLSVVSGGLHLFGFLAGPPTCGLSLVLTSAGTAIGVASGIAGIANDIKHFGIVKQNWENILSSIEKHISTCEVMVDLLEQLQEIGGFQIGIRFIPILKSVYTVWSVCCSMRKLITDLKTLRSQLFFKTPQKMATFSSRLAYCKTGLFHLGGIALNTYTICSGNVELSNLNNGNLCTDAEKLRDLKVNLQEESENVKKLVKDITSFYGSK